MQKTRDYYEKLNSMGLAELTPIPEDQLKELLEKVDSGEKFPPDVCITGSRYERYTEKDFSDEEIKRVLMFKLLQDVGSIKKGITFFVVLTVISLILSIVALAL